MSNARHHAEWLSLVEASGPFVSLPVLLQAFPQGLEAHDPDHLRRLKLAYDEWQDNQQGSRPDPAIHRAWVAFVLTETLALPEEVLLGGQSIPTGLQVNLAEHGETLRPDWVVIDPGPHPPTPSPHRGEGEPEASSLTPPSPHRGEGGRGGEVKPRLLVQLYPANQALEKSVKGSRWAASPATRMMELLHACEVRLGLITNGEQWMLVNAPRGETTGYISWYATLWQEENITLRAFRSLLGVERFFNVPDGETLEALLTQSVNSQQDVTDQLGYQVRRAVEVLVQSLDRIDQDRHRTLLAGVSETRLYEAALTVMMRLVFLFFAEENQLIPPQETAFYDTFYAVTTLREQLREQADQNGEEILERKHDAWCRLLATFRAVHGGVHHDALYIPAYGGSLFNPDRFPFLEGRKEGTRWLEVSADPIPVNNRTVLHLLEALQVLQVRVPGGGVESRKLSFRALDIEQIGHVYEGLLDHTAVRAKDTILGLVGTKTKEPEVALEELERLYGKGEQDLLGFLNKATGKSEAALKKLIPSPPHPLTPSPTRGEGEQESAVSPPSPALGEGGRGGEGLDAHSRSRLLMACYNDSALFNRVLPWAKLIRPDTFDHPTVIPAGSVFVTQGTDRRETGTHYTPRSLTEEIVKYTLEPLVYEGVAEGKPKEDWRLKSAPDLLSLKICDMAMGSGAFLVQVCRYLSERLVEAWEMEIDPHPQPLSPGRGGPESLPQERGGPEDGRDLAMEKLAGQLRQIPEALLERAKELRQQQTTAETILWECLRDRHLQNAKFRRQHNIGQFIADFYCHQARLVVELDGEVHHSTIERDAMRDDWMTQQGLQVLRFTNEQVFENLEAVLGAIVQALSPHPLAPSPQGEGGQEVAVSPLSLGRGAGGEGSGESPYLRILPDGSLSVAEPGEAILPNDPDERLAVARRLVADRCLYGVDKNPMAVEMAKLSLWLITLQKNRPFTFLDHALRCGDSLLGITSREQIEFLHLNPDKEAVQLRTVSEIWRPLLAQAIAKRQELESFTVNDIQDLARKEALQAEAEELTRNIKIAADYLIGEALAQAGKTGNLKVEDLGVLSGLVTDALEEADERARENKLRQIREKAQRMLNAGKPEGQPPREPFHWALEFPEVFLDGPHPLAPSPQGEGEPESDVSPLSLGRGAGGEGFSAIVGNPPFQGGQKITGTVGTDYRDVLVEYIANGKRGSADLCAYFFLNAGNLLTQEGYFGLVATNTIAQGDTREVGLDQLVAQGHTIPRAVPSRPWPGAAALEVAYMWLHKGHWHQTYVLNDQPVDGITPFLTVPGKAVGNPYRLVANENKSFIGSYVLGMGFVLEPEEAQALIAKDPKNKDVLFPYLNGQDLNSNPDQSPSRWVINFQDWPLDADHDDPKKPKGAPYAVDYPDCLAIVREKVKPERDKNKRKERREKWWQYAEKCPALYGAIAECDRVLCRAITGIHHAFAFISTDIVIDQTAPAYVFEDYATFALLQSDFNNHWAWANCSTMRQWYRYTPSDGFQTFPFPENTGTLEHIGETYYTHRQTIMQTRQEGLTKTYNRFHDPTYTDPDIQTLRHLHIQMDNAVAAAYGWHDLPLNHDFHDTKQGLRFTISEAARREILDRLLALNHQRYAEEVAQGLHDKKKAKGKSKKAKSKPAPAADPSGKYTTQGNLLGHDTPTQGELF